MKKLERLVYALVAAVEMPAVAGLRLENRFPPLFILGAPRSGTTVVYLHVMNSFEFAYFPNLAKAHPKACVLYSLWGRLAHAYEPTYTSSYGNVDGPMAPTDGWDIFHRWFPRYDHTRPIRQSGLYELRNIVRLLELVFGAPFANKNNSNSLRIAHLSALFPNAIFLHVRRDPVDASVSLLEARIRHGVPLGEWWSASPPQFLGRRFSDQLEQAVHQVWGIDRYIRDSLDRIPPERRHSIAYEAFCADPGALERQIERSYARMDVTLRRRPGAGSAWLRPRSRPREAELEARIHRIIERLESGSAGGRVHA
ncbi:MAG TPA: sulfotransferase [Longimicrobiales bacterium]